MCAFRLRHLLPDFVPPLSSRVPPTVAIPRGVEPRPLARQASVHKPVHYETNTDFHFIVNQQTNVWPRLSTHSFELPAKPLSCQPQGTQAYAPWVGRVDSTAKGLGYGGGI